MIESAKDSGHYLRMSRFSEEQIIGILKEHQAGLSAAEICRRHGISNACQWQLKFPQNGQCKIPQFGVSGGQPGSVTGSSVP